MSYTSITTWFTTTDERKLRSLVTKMDNAELNHRYDGAVAISAEGDLSTYFDGEDYEASLPLLQELIAEDAEFLVYVLNTFEMRAEVYRVTKTTIQNISESALHQLATETA